MFMVYPLYMWVKMPFCVFLATFSMLPECRQFSDPFILSLANSSCQSNALSADSCGTDFLDIS